MENFTQEELHTLADCVLRQMNNSGKAISMTVSSKVVNDLREELNFLQKLNSKLCSMMEDD